MHLSLGYVDASLCAHLRSRCSLFLVGAAELAKHGQNYGKWCAAWEDGMCTPPTPPNGTMVPNWDQGKHSCTGSIAKNCSTHWPSYDFSKDQSW